MLSTIVSWWVVISTQYPLNCVISMIQQYLKIYARCVGIQLWYKKKRRDDMVWNVCSTLSHILALFNWWFRMVFKINNNYIWPTRWCCYSLDVKHSPQPHLGIHLNHIWAYGASALCNGFFIAQIILTSGIIVVLCKMPSWRNTRNNRSSYTCWNNIYSSRFATYYM